MQTLDLMPSPPSFSSSSSSPPSTYSSASPAAVGHARPFQPVEPCDCGTTYCRCGLQIPQCLVEVTPVCSVCVCARARVCVRAYCRVRTHTLGVVQDHAQVCTRPEWDAFKCSLQCGSAFGSWAEATAHLKFCSKYIVTVRTPPSPSPSHDTQHGWHTVR